LDGLPRLRFSVHLGDGTLVVLLLGLPRLAFGAAASISLLSKETTFGGLPRFLDTLAAETTTFVLFGVLVLDSLDFSIATFLQLPTP
jgi:hypothetical protein